MPKITTNMDRSLVFTALLNLSPTFASMETRTGEQVTTRVVEAWQASPALDLYAFVQDWLVEHPLVTCEVVTT